MEITWRDKTITCEEGTTLFDISKQVEKEYEFPIIVAKVDGVIQELYHEVIDGTTVSFCTTKDSDGKRAYIRGMSMLLLKAIQEEKAFKEEDRITIDFCLDSGYYCHLNSKEKPTKELLNRLEKRMREDVKKDIRFEKVVMRTRDARRMFEKKHMSDKSNLLKYRRNSRMTVYHLGDFTDYYYGAMPYSTGILTHFRLELFEDGFVFVVPKKEAPVTMPEFKPSIKQYHTMQMANEWSEKMQVSTVGELNEIIVNGGFQELTILTAACTGCECLPEIATGAERPRNDKLGGHCLFNIGPHFPPVQRREGTARPLQRAVDGPSKCKKPGMPDFPASPIGSLTYRTVPWRGRGGRPRSGSSAAPRGLRCRWSRRRSCRRSYPHRRAPWQPRSACRASAP